MKKLLILLMFVMLSSFVLAVPPVTTIQSFSEGYIIKAPIQEIHQQNRDYTFNFHVFNISNGMPKINSSSISCYFHLYNSSGNHIFNTTPTSYDYIFDYQVKVKGGNFSLLDEYHYVFQCNTSNRGGFIEDYFYITKNGSENVPTNNTSFFIIALVFLSFGIVVLYFLYKTTEMWLRLVLAPLFALIIMSLTRFMSWFVSLTSPHETELIKTLDYFYMFGVWGFRFTLIICMLFLVYIIVSIFTNWKNLRKQKRQREKFNDEE